MQTHARIAAWLFLGLPLAGCGEADLGREGLEVRFAATAQALGEPDGLPVEVRSLQLEAYRQGLEDLYAARVSQAVPPWGCRTMA